MKRAIKSLALLVLGLGTIAVGSLWLDATSIAQVNKSASYESAKVPPPKPGQKKVVLKNLGMT